MTKKYQIHYDYFDLLHGYQSFKLIHFWMIYDQNQLLAMFNINCINYFHLLTYYAVKY